MNPWPNDGELPFNEEFTYGSRENLELDTFVPSSLHYTQSEDNQTPALYSNPYSASSSSQLNDLSYNLETGTSEDIDPLAAPDSDLEHETSLLMFYLDHGFRIQFPNFEPPASSGGRTWLLALLTSTKPVYYATLSLSATFWELLYPNQYNLRSLSQPGDPKRFGLRAEQELQNHMQLLKQCVGVSHVRGTVNALASLMQMATLKSFPGAVENMSYSLLEYLKMAAPMFDLLVNSLSIASPTGPVSAVSDPEITSAQLNALWTVSPIPLLEYGETLSFEGYAALKFVVNWYLWLDSLSQISIASKAHAPFFNSYRHLHLFNSPLTPLVQLDQLMGCKNWVISLICEITELDHWKKSMQQANSFSVRELVSRSMTIEHRLTSMTSENFAHTGITTELRTKTDKILYITHVFALAALTYLHTVVSGFNSSLPEIRQSVYNTLAALEAIANPQTILPHVFWPFCITGCIVGPEHEHRFRDLIAQARAPSQDQPTFDRWSLGLLILENVWNKRSTGQPLRDLADAMQIGGIIVLLI